MTESALEKRLWYQLSLSDIVWRKPTKKAYAMVVSEQGQRHRISLPPGCDDDYTLRYLLHELAHVAIGAELGAFGAFEEDILERVIEPRMMDYLLRHPKRHEKWLAALRKAKDGRQAAN